jgi:RNA polymerase sigma factor (sigma-70 family)
MRDIETEYERRTFERRLKEHRGYCRRFARRQAYRLTAEQFEDLWSDVIALAWRYYAGFKGETDAAWVHWVCSIAVRANKDCCRRLARRNEISLIECDQLNTLQDPRDYFGPCLEGVDLFDLPRYVRAPYRETFALACQGMSYAAISAHLGVPVNTVKSRISRAYDDVERALVEA